MKFLTVILAMTVLPYSAAQACSCEEFESAKEVLEYSDFAFLGIPMQNSKPTNLVLEQQKVVKTNFLVLKGFKNVGVKEITIYSVKGDGGNCGVSFKMNEAIFLVSASKVGNAGRPYTGGCELGVADSNPKMVKIIKDLYLGLN